MNSTKIFHCFLILACLFINALPFSAHAQEPKILISDPYPATSLVQPEWAEIEIDGVTQPCDATTTCMLNNAINFDVSDFVYNPPFKFEARARYCRQATDGPHCSAWEGPVFFDFAAPDVTPSGLRVVSG